MSPKEIRDGIRNLDRDAGEFFAKAAEHLKDERPRPSEPDYLWDKLPDELQESAEALSTRLLALLEDMMPAIQNSPTLTEPDQRDVGFIVKELRAALRLRRYQHWEIEVLHDEGTVLGVQPAGQSDNAPLFPRRAEVVFHRGAERLISMMDLVIPGPGLGALAPSTAAPSGPAVRPGTAFIMMWMDPKQPELVDVSDTVKRCFEKFGIQAVRSDDIQHEDLITRKILDQIRTAEFLFADLTGERPSVYYEVGFAHAIGRRVILYRRQGTVIHFDLAGYNCPEYKNLHDLEEQLRKRLQYVTGEKER